MTYILKDSFWADGEYQQNLQKAYSYISKAIDNRPESAEKYHIYEFNRLVLGINIEDGEFKKNLKNDLKVVENDSSCVHMLGNTSMTIAPNLSQWLKSIKVAAC